MRFQKSTRNSCWLYNLTLNGWRTLSIKLQFWNLKAFQNRNYSKLSKQNHSKLSFETIRNFQNKTIQNVETFQNLVSKLSKHNYMRIVLMGSINLNFWGKSEIIFRKINILKSLLYTGFKPWSVYVSFQYCKRAVSKSAVDP